MSLLEPFQQYAATVGTRISVVADQAEAAKAILAATDGAIKVVEAIRTNYPALLSVLEAEGRVITIAEDIAAQQPDRSLLAAELAGGIGIVLAYAGVAETGSLILADDALAPRLLSMLADVCIALLPHSDIVPGLDEAGAILSDLNAQGHRYVSLVTGPSRTADIERVLTIGVQGPKSLHIIVLTEEGAENA
ncbi:MAG: LUD domain-containing protein [Chloroflexia bacterium]